MIRVGVSGAKGRMGKAVAASIDDLHLIRQASGSELLPEGPGQIHRSHRAAACHAKKHSRPVGVGGRPGFLPERFEALGPIKSRFRHVGITHTEPRLS